MASRRKRVPKAIRLAVLTEAGYRCAVPTCRTILAIDLHHLVQVSDNGSDEAANLLALCPTCHALHHRGEIPREALLLYKANLVGHASVAPANTRNRLKVLYFHSGCRTDGFDYISSPRLVAELESRGHLLRFCWVVLRSLLRDDSHNLSQDILLAEAVRKRRPNTLVFEGGLFRGEPRIPFDLLDALEADGAVALIEIPPNEHHESKERYDPFLKSRGIEVETTPDGREPPGCRSHNDSVLVTQVDVLRKYTSVDAKVYQGVGTVVAAAAIPLHAWNFSKILLLGGDDVFVKAYGNYQIHGNTHPIYGVLHDRNFKTEAIFLANVLYDSSTCPDNATYFANLLEWLHHCRTSSECRGAKTRSTS